METCCLLLVLVLVLGSGVQQTGSQHYYLLRPVPGASLPVELLREDPDPLLDPEDKDLNETQLRGALGGHFDPRVMSVSAPEDRSPGEDRDEAEPSDSTSGRIRTRTLDGRKRRRLRLRSSGLCPVLRTWSDLGTRFWPRYVKLGRCYSRRSCSVPEGMICRPAKASRLTVLRWRCGRKTGLRCAWIPVQYPVVTECKCSCSG